MRVTRGSSRAGTRTSSFLGGVTRAAKGAVCCEGLEEVGVGGITDRARGLLGNGLPF